MTGVLSLSARAASATPPAVTFVQLTDVHLFDAENPRARVANQAALSLAVLRINEMVTAGKVIDFVVFTGGLGTEALAAEELDGAFSALAPILNALQIDKIFWVPGEHVTEEAPDVTFSAVVDRLAESLKDKQLVDLATSPQELKGIQFFGLNSAALSLAEEDPAALRELERIGSQIESNRAHVVFTHTADLVGASEPVTGAPLPFWKSPGVRQKWTDLALRPEVTAVFAGGVHLEKHAVYDQSYDALGAERPPKLLAKTWVCPSLGSLETEKLEPLSRGLRTVTVNQAGKVSTSVSWLPPAESRAQDKQGRLIAAEIAYDGWRLREAETAYTQALESTDAETLRKAEEGLLATRARMKGFRWQLVDGFPPIRYLVEHWMLLTVGALLVAFAFWLLGLCCRKRLRLVLPQSLTDKAPAQLWLAEFMVALAHNLDVLRKEGQDFFSTQQYAFGPPSTVIGEITDALPTVGGIDSSKIWRLLMAVVGYLGWRLDSGVAINGQQEVNLVYLSLKKASRTKKVWRVPDIGTKQLDLAAVAQQAASDILWEMS